MPDFTPICFHLFIHVPWICFSPLPRPSVSSVLLYGWQMVHQHSYEVMILYCWGFFFFIPKRVECVNMSPRTDESSLRLHYAGDLLFKKCIAQISRGQNIRSRIEKCGILTWRCRCAAGQSVSVRYNETVHA